ncbi:MAG TPA: hypothetical protein VG754_02230 [Verrucomicrobiae bacterium]|jgi:hypothetical protein|nr:hypothetical protein [Verrucomicrobiae bacterium]
MLKPKIIITAVIVWLIMAIQSQAQIQSTNLVPLPATILENLESTTGQVIIKATAPVGSVNCNGAVITIVCKEDTMASTGHKEHGVTVGISINGQPDDRTVIDFDELDSLISSLDYLNGITWSVTSLSSFDAIFTTKAGLRVAVFSSKRSGQIEFALRSSRMDTGIIMPPDQRAQFRLLLVGAKAKLVALRNG